MPFNTEELISRAKKNFEEFGDKYRWRREWRRQQRHWNRQFRHMNEQLRTATAQAAPMMSQTARAIGGVFVPIAALIGAVLFVAWILALFSLVTQHNIFGWSLPHGMPMWVGITAAGDAVRRHLRRRCARCATAGYAPAVTTRPGARCTASCGSASSCCSSGSRTRSSRACAKLVDQLMWAANLTVTTISETIV